MKADDVGARIVDKRRNWEARVEMSVFKLPKSELSTYDKLVYAILCGHANRDGNAMLYVGTIAGEASCSERQVRRALSNLETRRLLSRHPQSMPGLGQTHNVYEVYGFDEYLGGSVPGSNARSENARPPTASQSPRPLSVSPAPSAPQAGPYNVFEQPHKNMKEKTPLIPPQQENKSPTEVELHEAILKAYNAILPELPQAERITASRSGILRQRIEESPEREGLDWWRRFFTRVREYPWPMGDNPNNWRANFDWLIGEKGLQKILEGTFQRTSNFGEGTEAGRTLQKKHTDAGGRINAKALL